MMASCSNREFQNLKDKNKKEKITAKPVNFVFLKFAITKD